VGVNDKRVEYTTLCWGDACKDGKVIVTIAPALVLFDSSVAE